MNERIKEVRKSLGLTQNEFGEKLGVRGNTITNYESNSRKPSNAIISAICREFQINEAWLRTGEGEMKAPMTKQAEIGAITAQLFRKEETDPETYNFLVALNKTLLQLDETQMQAVLDMIRKLNAAISKGER